MNDVLLTTVTFFNTVCSGGPDEFLIIDLLTVNVFFSATDFGLLSHARCVVGWSPVDITDTNDKKCALILSSVK
jgi:hypothetical protein